MTLPNDIPPPALPPEAARPAPPRTGGPYEEWDTGRPSALAWVSLAVGALAPLCSFCVCSFFGPFIFGGITILMAVIEWNNIRNRQSSAAGEKIVIAALILGGLAVLVSLAFGAFLIFSMIYQ